MGVSEVLGRLTALCLMTAVSELLLGEGRLREGVRLICGLAAALLVMEWIAALAG